MVCRLGCLSRMFALKSIVVVQLDVVVGLVLGAVSISVGVLFILVIGRLD